MMNVFAKLRNISPDVNDRVLQLPVKEIIPNPNQPRKIFDKDELDELSESIKQYGVIQPVIVRKVSSNLYELIAGERRFRASCMAGLETVPGIIQNISDNDSAVLALIENLQRKDLSFMEEAESYRRLIENYGYTQETLSQKMGKNQSTISNKLRLLKLSDEVQEIIINSGLTERHARALLKLDKEQLQLKVLKVITDNNLNVAQSEKLIENTLNRINGNSKSQLKKKHIFKDMRIIINSIKQVIDVIKKQGFNAQTEKKENNDYIEYIIKIPKI